jgi:hypothetical protein
MAWQPNVNPDAQRFEWLRAELLARQIGKAAATQIQVVGDKYIVPISAQENSSTITDAAAVYRSIRVRGLETLLEAYTITLARARKLLSAAQQTKWIKTERTGPREIGEPVLRSAGPAA